MPSVSGSGPSAQYTQFQHVLTHLGSSVSGKISDVDAQKVTKAFDQLKGGEKADAAKALQAFLKSDAFELDDGARATFAKTLGVDADSLKPPAAAGGVKRSALQAGIKALAGATKIDEKQITKVFDAVKDVPKQIGDAITGQLKGANTDGEVKIDQPEARKKLVKEYAARNENGSVDYLNNKFGEEFTKKIPPYLMSCLSSPPLFEELVFVLMITLVNDTQKEVMEEQMRIQGIVKEDNDRAVQKEDRQKAIDAGLAKRGKGAKSEGEQADIDLKKPEVDPAHRQQVANTKAKLEGIVQAVDAHLRDDGMIDKSEAKAIVRKLNAAFPEKHPVRKLLAEAMGSAIQHGRVKDPLHPESPGKGILETHAMKDRIQPLFDWACKAAGKTDFPKPTPAEGSTESGAALQDSDKAERRLVGFLIDGFVDRAALKNSSTAETVQKFQPVVEELLATHAPGEAAVEKDKGTAGAVVSRFQRVMEGREKVAQLIKDGKLPAERPAKDENGKAIKDAQGKPVMEPTLPSLEKDIASTVEREMSAKTPEERQMMKDGLMKAAEKLPGGKAPTHDDCVAAFKAGRQSVVADLFHDDPAVKAGEEALLGKGIDDAIMSASDNIKNREDGKAPLSVEQKLETLNEKLAIEKERVLDEARSNGYTEKMLDGVAHAFDTRADQVRHRFEKSGGKIEPEKPNGMGADATSPTESNDTRSRQIMFEQLKFKMNMLSEMMQSMSNILNTMHTNSENTIRNIR